MNQFLESHEFNEIPKYNYMERLQESIEVIQLQEDPEQIKNRQIKKRKFQQQQFNKFKQKQTNNSYGFQQVKPYKQTQSQHFNDINSDKQLIINNYINLTVKDDKNISSQQTNSKPVYKSMVQQIDFNMQKTRQNRQTRWRKPVQNVQRKQVQQFTPERVVLKKSTFQPKKIYESPTRNQAEKLKQRLKKRDLFEANMMVQQQMKMFKKQKKYQQNQKYLEREERKMKAWLMLQKQKEERKLQVQKEVLRFSEHKEIVNEFLSPKKQKKEVQQQQIHESQKWQQRRQLKQDKQQEEDVFTFGFKKEDNIKIQEELKKQRELDNNQQQMRRKQRKNKKLPPLKQGWRKNKKQNVQDEQPTKKQNLQKVENLYSLLDTMQEDESDVLASDEDDNSKSYKNEEQKEDSFTQQSKRYQQNNNSKKYRIKQSNNLSKDNPFFSDEDPNDFKGNDIPTKDRNKSQNLNLKSQFVQSRLHRQEIESSDGSLNDRDNDESQYYVNKQQKQRYGNKSKVLRRYDTTESINDRENDESPTNHQNYQKKQTEEFSDESLNDRSNYEISKLYLKKENPNPNKNVEYNSNENRNEDRFSDKDGEYYDENQQTYFQKYKSKQQKQRLEDLPSDESINEEEQDQVITFNEKQNNNNFDISKNKLYQNPAKNTYKNVPITTNSRNIQNEEDELIEESIVSYSSQQHRNRKQQLQQSYDQQEQNDIETTKMRFYKKKKKKKQYQKNSEVIPNYSSKFDECQYQPRKQMEKNQSQKYDNYQGQTFQPIVSQSVQQRRQQWNAQNSSNKKSVDQSVVFNFQNNSPQKVSNNFWEKQLSQTKSQNKAYEYERNEVQEVQKSVDFNLDSLNQNQIPEKDYWNQSKSKQQNQQSAQINEEEKEDEEEEGETESEESDYYKNIKNYNYGYQKHTKQEIYDNNKEEYDQKDESQDEEEQNFNYGSNKQSKQQNEQPNHDLQELNYLHNTMEYTKENNIIPKSVQQSTQWQQVDEDESDFSEERNKSKPQNNRYQEEEKSQSLSDDINDRDFNDNSYENEDNQEEDSSNEIDNPFSPKKEKNQNSQNFNNEDEVMLGSTLQQQQKQERTKKQKAELLVFDFDSPQDKLKKKKRFQQFQKRKKRQQRRSAEKQKQKTEKQNYIQEEETPSPQKNNLEKSDEENRSKKVLNKNQRQQKAQLLIFDFDNQSQKVNKMKKYNKFKQRKMREMKKRQQERLISKQQQEKTPKKKQQRYLQPSSLLKKTMKFQDTEKQIKKPVRVKKVKKVKKVSQQSIDRKLEKSIQKEDIPYLTFILKPSNKQLLKMALKNVCLAGEINRMKYYKITEIMDDIEAGRFIILFKSAFGRQDFKGIYAIEADQKRVVQLFAYGYAPVVLTSRMVKNYYKYKNSAKEFMVLQHNKSFNFSVDAVSLKQNVLKKKRSKNRF